MKRNVRLKIDTTEREESRTERNKSWRREF